MRSRTLTTFIATLLGTTVVGTTLAQVPTEDARVRKITETGQTVAGGQICDGWRQLGTILQPYMMSEGVDFTMPLQTWGHHCMAVIPEKPFILRGFHREFVFGSRAEANNFYKDAIHLATAIPVEKLLALPQMDTRQRVAFAHIVEVGADSDDFRQIYKSLKSMGLEIKEE